MTVTIFHRLEAQSYQPIPLFLEPIPAGFPSPAEGYVEECVDLNDLCIDHPNATFLVRVDGLSMIDAGIYPNDLLVVDRSLETQHGDIIVARLFNEFTVKELNLYPYPSLIAHNESFEDITLVGEIDFEVFGVVTNVIRPIGRGTKRPIYK
ncbi:DNA polymerase V, subunit D [Moraxellaceae bacterium 17A]|nr:DNA polymerase V, subunit D [Moraxellaceae bacterium 17A]